MEKNEIPFSLVHPSRIKDFDPFDRIGNGWMLISAEHCGKVNTMTASWGLLGPLWGKQVVSFYVRPQRFTFSLLEGCSRMSLSFLGEKYRSALRICGSISGREVDKFEAASISCAHYGAVPYIAESEYVMICKKLYSDTLRSECFTFGEPQAHYRGDGCDLHKFYICEIEKILIRK